MKNATFLVATDLEVRPARHVVGKPHGDQSDAYSHEQGLTPRVLTPQEIYAPTLLDS